MTFAALFVSEKREKKKSYFMFLYGGSKPPPYDINPKYSQQKKQKIYSSFRPRAHLIHARHSFSAGVQAMRARICSAFSCAVFARVVWLRLRRVAKLSTYSISPVSHALATHGSRD